MVNYYEYETSPRKIQPSKTRSVKVTKNSNKTKKRVVNKNTALVNTTKTIIVSMLVFAFLLILCIRYAMLNAKLAAREKLKSNLIEIEKQNDQLKVSIERDMNISNIEQEAKEKLGMQKLTNSQKVYINLDKKDYVKSLQESPKTEETIISKIIKLFVKN